MAVTPDGKNAYVTNFFDNTVSQYNINPKTRKAHPKSPATVAAGSYPDAVALSPDGKSAYVTNRQRQHGFAVQHQPDHGQA